MPGLTNYGAGSQLNLGTEPKDRPHPDAPIEEHIVGGDYNNAYRGLETHGVEPTGRFDDVGFDDDAVREYEHDEPSPEPIPVKIVSSGAKEFKNWAVRREFAPNATGGSARILGQDESRTKAYVKNVGTAAIYISPDPINNSQLGYRIDTGVEFIYDQQGDMWALTDDANAQPIAILIEYSVSK